MTPPVVSSVMPSAPALPGAQPVVATGFEALLAALTPNMADPAGTKGEDVAQPALEDETTASPDAGLLGSFALTSLFVPPPPVALPQAQSISATEPALAKVPAAVTPAMSAPPADTAADAEVSPDDGALMASGNEDLPLASDRLAPPSASATPAAPVAAPAPRAEAAPGISRPAAEPDVVTVQTQAPAPGLLAEAAPASATPLPQPQQVASEAPELVAATTDAPKAEGQNIDAPKATTDASPDQAPLRPAAQAQQGQDNPGSGSDREPRQDGRAQAEAPSQTADTQAPASRNDFAAQPAMVAAAHGTVADQVRAAPHTVAHMAEQIVRKVDGQTTRFDIQLDPLGLGQVDVRIEIGADGQLKAAMSFETQSAANELQARSGELKRALEDAGFNLGGGLTFEVSRDASGSGRDLAQQHQQQQAQHDSRSGGGRAFQAAMDRADAPAEPVRAGEIYLQRRTLSGIDVRI